MKKLIASIMVVLLTGVSGVVSSYAAPSNPPPVIFFSDLTSGPKTGGKDNNGVFVTIVGRNFGPSKGSGSVTVGGGEASDYPVWNDSKISFQLGPKAGTGDIIVTTSAGKSNGIHFTVRNGRVLFVDAKAGGNGSGTFQDPWKSPADFLKSEQPGDTCYFRQGTYNGHYGNTGRSYNVSFYNMGTPSGSPDNEIAWVGYPGETAAFRADGNEGITNGAFEFMGNVQYHVIAGLSLYGIGDGREQVRLYSDNCKLVNNKIEGIKTLSYAMIGVTASNLKIWGNECFGATSRNKLDHIVYFQQGGSNSNVDIGWNYFHDNDIGPGPIFSWNLGNGTSNNIMIHDNKIDCRNSSDTVRLAGIWSGSSGSMTFANNVVIGSGGSMNDPAYNAIYDNFAAIKVYNNTFYQSKGAGGNHVVNVYGSGQADVKNNVFYNTSSIGYVNGNVTADSNLYFGGSGSVPSDDKHAVTADPKFTNAGSGDFHIAQDSPAVGKGADTTSVIRSDYDGVPRKAGSIAIGAFQYDSGGWSPWDTANGLGSSAGGANGQIVGPGQVRIVGPASGRGVVNPAKGEKAEIYFQGTGTGSFKCRVFTLRGDLVWDSAKDNVTGGIFEWTPPQYLASGIYLANVQGPGVKATQKIALLQ